MDRRTIRVSRWIFLCLVMVVTGLVLYTHYQFTNRRQFKSRYLEGNRNIPTGNRKSFKFNAVDLNKVFGELTLPEVNCSQRLLIYECSSETEKCYGLNDRIRGILSSFLLAVMTGRTFVINVIEPCPLSKYFEPNMYDWSKCLTTYRNSTDRHYVNYRARLSNVEFLKTLHDDPWEARNVVITSNVIMLRYLVENPMFWKKNMWLSHMSKRNPTTILFHTMFKVKQPFRRDFLDYFEHITDNRTKKLVGIHVRSYYSDASVIQDMFEFAEKFTDYRKYSLYLATDLLSVREQAVARLPNCHFLNNTGVELHISGVNATCTSLYYALFDLHVLSMSDILMKTSSGFSNLAYRINSGRGIVYQF